MDTAWAGEMVQQAQQLTRKDVQNISRDAIEYASSQGVENVDLGKQILLSMADEIGYWKIIIIAVVVIGATFGIAIWQGFRWIRKRHG